MTSFLSPQPAAKQATISPALGSHRSPPLVLLIPVCTSQPVPHRDSQSDLLIMELVLCLFSAKALQWLSVDCSQNTSQPPHPGVLDLAISTYLTLFPLALSVPVHTPNTWSFFFAGSSSCLGPHTAGDFCLSSII